MVIPLIARGVNYAWQPLGRSWDPRRKAVAHHFFLHLCRLHGLFNLVYYAGPSKLASRSAARVDMTRRMTARRERRVLLPQTLISTY